MLAAMALESGRTGGTPRGRGTGSSARARTGGGPRSASGERPGGERPSEERHSPPRGGNSNRGGNSDRGRSSSRVRDSSRAGRPERARANGQPATGSRAGRGSTGMRAGTTRWDGTGQWGGAGQADRVGSSNSRYGRPGPGAGPSRRSSAGGDDARLGQRANTGEMTRMSSASPRPGGRGSGGGGTFNRSRAAARPFDQSNRERGSWPSRTASSGAPGRPASPARGARPRPYAEAESFDSQRSGQGPRWGRSFDPRGNGPSFDPSGNGRSFDPRGNGRRQEPAWRSDTGGSRTGGQSGRGQFERGPNVDRGARRYEGDGPRGIQRQVGRGSTSASVYEGDSSRGFPRQAGRGSTSGSRYAGSRYAGGRGDADRETGRQGTSTRRNTGEAPAVGGRARDGRAVSRGGYGPDRGVRDGGRDFGRDAGNNAWRPAPRRTVPKGWGSVTRHGVRELDYDGGSASAIWSRTQERARAESGRPSSVTAAKPVVRDSFTYEPSSPSDSGGWAATLVETVPASSSPRRSSKSPGPKARATKDREAPRKRVSASRPAFPQQGGTGEGLDHKVGALLGDATRAYSADRYQDALRILRRLSTQAPTSAPVKELLGLTLYRLGKWPLAVRELQAHHELSGSYDQFPVIADCHRATRRYAEADAVWAELRKASPSAEVIAEGRMVAAGCLADQGDLKGAVELLEGSLKRSKPRPQHLRQWYALADLYERAGELSRARDLFAQIADVDPTAYDVRQRLVALG